MSDGESGSLGRRDHSLWKLGTELADRIADLCSRGACPQRLLNHVVERLKCNPLNFRPQFPEPLWSVGLEILDGPISIDWRNWTVEILVQDWIGGDGGDWTGWREVTRLLGMRMPSMRTTCLMCTAKRTQSKYSTKRSRKLLQSCGHG